MTTDSNQSPSDLPELPESLKRFGEGPLGDSFRALYAEMVKEFTPEDIGQIVSGNFTTPEGQDSTSWKAKLEAEGWTVLTSSISPLELIRSARSADEDLVVFLDRPEELSENENLQAAARPTRYCGLPDDFILLRPDAKTIDQRVKDLLSSRLVSIPKSEDSTQRTIDPELFRTVEVLLPDEEAAAAPRKARKAEDTVTVPVELWHALRGVLNTPGLRDALVELAEKDGYRSDWYADDLDVALAELSAFEAEQATDDQFEQEANDRDPFRAREISAKIRSFVESQVKPSLDAATEGLKARGTQTHEFLDKFYLDQLRSHSISNVELLVGILAKLGAKPKVESEDDRPETPEVPEEVFVDYLRLIESTGDSKSDEPRTGKSLSADFTVQDLVASYDETKISDVLDYITLRANRFPVLYAQLVELLSSEGFSDRDRLVMVLGALDGYEASDDYGIGDAYHISQIRQLLKRR